MSPAELSGPEAIRAARSNWRRRQIVDAAMPILEGKGFHQMSVNDLAGEAGVSVGTIYQYVKNKEDVLLLVIKDILDTYAVEVPAAMAGIDDPLERLSVGYRAYCGVVDGRRAATLVGYGESRTLDKEGLELVKRLENETTALIVSCLDEGVRAGLLAEHDTELSGWNLVMLAHMWSLKHWHMSVSRSLDEYARDQLAMTLRAVVLPEMQGRYAALLHLPAPRSAADAPAKRKPRTRKTTKT
jgi:TetR/AcrR family transcriptional regulator, cholesterol catabolism regulator